MPFDFDENHHRSKKDQYLHVANVGGRIKKKLIFCKKNVKKIIRTAYLTLSQQFLQIQFWVRNVLVWHVVHRTGYKIKDDRNFLGTFIMSFYVLVTHIFKYYCMYYSVRFAENTINQLFIFYFTNRNYYFVLKLQYTIHLLWYNNWHYNFMCLSVKLNGNVTWNFEFFPFKLINSWLFMSELPIIHIINAPYSRK